MAVTIKGFASDWSVPDPAKPAIATEITTHAIPVAVDAGDTQAKATKRVEFTDAATAKGSMIDLWHAGNGGGNVDGATYALDIHNKTGAKQALVTHQYSNVAPAWQLDNTDDNVGILIRNTENQTLNPGRTGTGSPFLFKDYEVTRFQVFNRGEVYINPGPNALGHGVEIVGDATAAKNLMRLHHNGPQHGLNIISASGAAGWYPFNVAGWNYGGQIATSQDGGTTLQVTKNGAGSGVGVLVTNKGTGATAGFRNATALVSAVMSNGEFEHFTAGAGIVLKAPGGVRYRVTVTDAGAVQAVAA